MFVLKEDGVFSHLCPPVTSLTTTGAPWNESSAVQSMINDTWNREFSDLHSWWTLLYDYYIHNGLISLSALFTHDGLISFPLMYTHDAQT